MSAASLKPDWISSADYREYRRLGELSKMVLIDGISPQGYVGRFTHYKCEHPVPFRMAPSKMRVGGFERCKTADTIKVYRLLDICAFARARGHSIENPESAIRETASKLEARRGALRHLQYEMNVVDAEIEALESRLAKRSHLKAMHYVSMLHAHCMIASVEQVVAAAQPHNGTATGIYFLVKGREIVYVGQSVNVPARVAQHLLTKEFDSACYLPVAADALDLMETIYIHLFTPKLNVSSQTGTPIAPLGVHRLRPILEGAQRRYESDNRNP